MNNHAFYEFLYVKHSDDGGLGAILRKHAGDYFWGLIKSKGVEVWESEKGCKEILGDGQKGVANGEGRIAQYNIEQMTIALNQIKKSKK